MIPQRIRLSGFLCYREEQCIDFDGNATLWMLSGLNGSGKSAIFDAVTFSLFGHHRGGGQQAVELINKDSDTLLVEFDFLLDNVLHRAKRTVKRDNRGGSRGTQQMFRLVGDNWVPIEGTGQKREFDAWVAEHIGLSYETFTSSVLLLQGKAEKLLDSKPEGRREVLAGIVDLDRYERMYQKADERRRANEATLKALAGRLAALPAVAPLELAEARNHITEAEAARKAARAEVERWQGIEFQSRNWQDLQVRLAQVRKRLQKAQLLLTDASAIEKAVERLRELREVLPRLNEIVVMRSQARQADETIRFYHREREKQQENLAKKDNAVKQASDKRQLLHNSVARDESKHRQIAARLRESAVLMARLAEAERHEADLVRLRQDLKEFPNDPASLVATQRDLVERLEGQSRIVPILNRFQGRREELAQSVSYDRTCEQTLAGVRARGESSKQLVERLRPVLEAKQVEAQQAAEQATAARTLLQQARESLLELTDLTGAKVCRHCGQSLTPGHLEEEKRRRSAAVTLAEQRSHEATAKQDLTRMAFEQARKELEQAEKHYQDAREEYREVQTQKKQARAAVDRAQEECARLYADLPEPFRLKISPQPVSDWLTTTYPTSSDLDALQAMAREVDPARRKLREADQLYQRWGQLKAQEATTLDTLNRLLRDLPPDRQAVRGAHLDLESEERALFKSVDAAREQITLVDKELVRLTRERDQAQAELANTETRLKQEQLVQQNAERGIALNIKELPALWQSQAEQVMLRELQTLKAERETLEREGTEERGRELEQARTSLLVLEQDLRALEKQESTYPPESREHPEKISARLLEVRQRQESCEDQLSRVREKLALLESYLEQRRQLDEEYRQLEAEQQANRLLAELLGKDRLQLYLVRQAERQVVEYANAVLDRLSGGQLYLKLSGEAGGEGTSAKALDLEAYNRATGERPINVAFLSGSQKFRVAVSLALGIGQYASRQHRPIESVIIDEGFGCLDSQGRQVMIQELQNLRSQMRCILLVSHQEDFAESFTDGYQFKLEKGATKVERFRR